MRYSWFFIPILIFVTFCMLYSSAFAQVGVFSREDLIAYTPKWAGERFPDGRPRVTDDILRRMRNVTITQAWGVLREEGYNWQYEGDWVSTHPDSVIVGRALTALFMPRRPDVRDVMLERGKIDGRKGDQIHWPIEELKQGDIYIADVFGKIKEGAVIGDNLAAAIYSRAGRGVVHNASVRDIDGIKEMPGFASLVRGWHPSYASPTIMLMGINVPLRLGNSVVMPGDVVLGGNGSVIFIPPHLAEKVVTTSEIVHLRDRFGKLRLSEGVYSPGQIDAGWTEEIEKDFSRWLNDHINELPVPRETIQEFLKKRTW